MLLVLISSWKSKRGISSSGASTDGVADSRPPDNVFSSPGHNLLIFQELSSGKVELSNHGLEFNVRYDVYVYVLQFNE